MKCWSLLLYIGFNCADCPAQVNDMSSNVLQDIKLKKQTIYIFARGTTSKSALISHKFNYADTNITHVGIGYIEKGNIYIYNVTDNTGSNKSALVIDSLRSFISGEDVFYSSIWECTNTIKEYKAFVRFLKKSVKRKISFDPFFRLNDNDRLYCSEFCYKALKAASRVRLKFAPRLINLNNELYEKILNTKVLAYFPVDFFQVDSAFKKIYEVRFSEHLN